MKHHLKTLTLAIALSVTGLAALAQSAPWERPRPANMTAAHEAQADAAMTALRRAKPQNLGINLEGLSWTWSSRSNAKRPVGNMDVPALREVMVGRYHISQSETRESWDVRYFAADGKVHECTTRNGRTYTEAVSNLVTKDAVIGFAGVIFSPDSRLERANSSEMFGWPIVADRSSGIFSIFRAKGGSWIQTGGWLQSEYVPIFAEKCPNLPRAARVNNEQGGETIQEIARNARAFRDFKVAFQSDPRDPLTAEMLYFRHPPQR